MRRLTMMVVLILAAVCSQPGAGQLSVSHVPERAELPPPGAAGSASPQTAQAAFPQGPTHLPAASGAALVREQGTGSRSVWGTQQRPPAAISAAAARAPAFQPTAAGDSQVPATSGAVQQAVCLQSSRDASPSAAAPAEQTRPSAPLGQGPAGLGASEADTSVGDPSPGSVRLNRPAAQPPLPLSRPGETSESAGRGSRGTLGSMVTVAGSLAVVLGLFLAVAWLLRRAAPKSLTPLPAEVVEVLGRAPLAGRQQMHLLRCGRKLLLVSVTPAGAETLTEITDPAEVDRLAGLCQQARPGSTTAAFRQVFQQATGRYPTGPDKETELDATYGARAGTAGFESPGKQFHG